MTKKAEAPKQPKRPKKPAKSTKALARTKAPARAKKAKPAWPMYTQKLADAICKRLADGESLRSIARTPGFPTEASIREWSLDATRPFASQYARARAAGYHKLADELLEIADDAERDLIEREDGTLAADHQNVQRSKLRVDTRKWILSKMLPKLYGDKFQVGGDGGGAAHV